MGAGVVVAKCAGGNKIKSTRAVEAHSHRAEKR
jgi:hypothetical protein